MSYRSVLKFCSELRSVYKKKRTPMVVVLIEFTEVGLGFAEQQPIYTLPADGYYLHGRLRWGYLTDRRTSPKKFRKRPFQGDIAVSSRVLFPFRVGWKREGILLVNEPSYSIAAGKQNGV